MGWLTGFSGDGGRAPGISAFSVLLSWLTGSKEPSHHILPS